VQVPDRDDSIRFLLKVLILVAFVLCVLLLLNRNNRPVNAGQQQLAVSVEQLKGAPLEISSVVVDSSNPREPSVTYFIANTGGKAVSSYAIRYVVGFGTAQSESADLRYGFFNENVFQPTTTEPGGWEGHAFSAPVKSVRVILDFVEFTDGTSWGPDVLKSSEQLAGLRAGAQAELDGLRALQGSGDIRAVQNGLTDFDPAVPSGHSPVWTDGFRRAVVITRGRLKRVSTQALELERELSRPIHQPMRSSK
jgi:hypothetical protein